jgi:hypothetical protein
MIVLGGHYERTPLTTSIPDDGDRESLRNVGHGLRIAETVAREDFVESQSSQNSFMSLLLKRKVKAKKKVKISLLQTVEVPRVARGRGSHVT